MLQSKLIRTLSKGQQISETPLTKLEKPHEDQEGFRTGANQILWGSEFGGLLTDIWW
jgi:hypothetical protein